MGKPTMNLQLFAEEDLMTTEADYDWDADDYPEDLEESDELDDPIEEPEVSGEESDEEVDDLQEDLDEPETAPEGEETKDAFLQVQYNKDKIDLSREETITYAQKGMNYDKVYNRNQELETKVQRYEQNKLYKWAEDYMKQTGFDDPEAFVRAVEIDKKKRAYESKGMSPEQAKTQAEQELRISEMENKLSEKEQVEKEEAEFRDFLGWHREMEKAGVFKERFDAEKIPTEVWQKTKDGQPLKVAYMEWQLRNQKSQTEQETIKKLTENKKRTAGSVNSDSQSQEPEFTIEYIEKMIDAHGRDWVAKNMKKIEATGYFDD